MFIICAIVKIENLGSTAKMKLVNRYVLHQD